MSAHPITLHLPEPLYEHVRKRAKQARRSLEAELLRIVATAAPGEGALGQLVGEEEATGSTSSRELSLEEAAALLNVSRAYVIQLLDDGKLPYHEIGEKRTVELGALVSYKQRDLARRRRILAELTAEAQGMGLDY